MLSRQSIYNIDNFDKLSSNYRRVLKHRLKKKCNRAIIDLQYILLNKDKLKLKKDDIVNPLQLIDLQEAYENT